MKLQHVISLLEKTIENKTKYRQQLIDDRNTFNSVAIDYMEINLEELNKILDDLRQVKEI